MTTAYYAAPQAPDDARRLFGAACRSVGLDGDRPLEVPLRPGRGWGSSLVLAREWELADLEARLVDGIEASFQPTWDRARGEFTWGMNLDEPHPRGQFNAFLAAAEAAGPGRWERLSAKPVPTVPQVLGVDFPDVALSRAEWVGSSLYLTLAPLKEDPNRFTSFRIENPGAHMYYLTGIEGTTMDIRSQHTVVRAPMVHGTLEFTPGSY